MKYRVKINMHKIFNLISNKRNHVIDMIVDVFVSVPQCAFLKTYFKILIEFLFLFSIKTFRNVLLILCRMSKVVFFSYLNK